MQCRVQLQKTICSISTTCAYSEYLFFMA